MKILLGLLVITSFIANLSEAQSSRFEINGKLEKIKKGTIILNIYEGDKTLRDSAIIKNGEFYFAGDIAAPSFATLTMPVRRKDFFTFYIEPVSMNISGRGDSLQLLKVQGSGVNDDDRLLNERMKYITSWQETNSKIYEEAYKNKRKVIMDSLDEVDNDILAEKRKIVAAFVREYPNSMRGAMAITENFGYYAEASDVQPLYDQLSGEIKNSDKRKEIEKLIQVYSSVAVGKKLRLK